jgi:SAM-dependent methyltransferase
LRVVGADRETAVVDRDALTDEVRSTYDAVAEEYASEFPGTEPEQAGMRHRTHVPLPVRSGMSRPRCGSLAGMIAMAQRDHPDITTQVASITDLPFPDARFDGVLYWYSIIHVADSDLAAVWLEARRVLRPNGVVLVAFQAGEGACDAAGGYRSLGYDVSLTRFHRTVEEVSRVLLAAGFTEEARLVRRPLAEKHDQAFVLFRAEEANG